MLITDSLSSAHLGVGLRASSQADALRQLVGLVAEAPEVLDPDRLLDAVTSRERRISTGVGDGLALPHAWTSAVSGLVVAVASFESPVEWHALDGAPVELAILLAGPDADARTRVRHLAHVSRVLSSADTRERLTRATHPSEMAQVLTEAEQAL